MLRSLHTGTHARREAHRRARGRLVELPRPPVRRASPTPPVPPTVPPTRARAHPHGTRTLCCRRTGAPAQCDARGPLPTCTLWGRLCRGAATTPVDRRTHPHPRNHARARPTHSGPPRAARSHLLRGPAPRLHATAPVTPQHLATTRRCPTRAHTLPWPPCIAAPAAGAPTTRQATTTVAAPCATHPVHCRGSQRAVGGAYVPCVV